jgi:Asp/Glu/Hydantoin racemase
VRLLVTNCNTSAAVSAVIGAEARRAARAGTEIMVRTPSWGVSSAESWYDSYISAASVLDLATSETEHFDAVVMAGFGEPGREGLREQLEVPVVDITEAAVAIAGPLGHRYAILTSLRRTSAQIMASLLTAGLSSGCAGVYAIEQPRRSSAHAPGQGRGPAGPPGTSSPFTMTMAADPRICPLHGVPGSLARRSEDPASEDHSVTGASPTQAGLRDRH